MAIRSLNEARQRKQGLRRNQGRKDTAFVLGGGGNLGAIQVGQLMALVERGIIPDVVIGCSVGALNGAAVAGNPTVEGVKYLAEVWKTLGRDDIFSSSSSLRGPWQFLKNGLSAFNDSGLRRLIDKLAFARFEDAVVPFWVVATSLSTGLEKWFNSGEVTAPILASAALPGAFPPVEIEDDTYIDGGVVDNVPVSKAFELGCKNVYVLDVANFQREASDPKRPYEVLMRAVSIAREHRFRTEQDLVPDGTNMINMPAVDPGKLRYSDFRRTGELIERSYRVCAEFLRREEAAKPA